MENIATFRIKNDLTKFFDINSYTYNHTLRVYNSVLNHYTSGEFSTKLQIVALFHDVVEDTKYTIADLKEMYFNDFIEFFGEEFIDKVIDAILVITRYKDETYKDYIYRVKTNKLASIVKVLDLEDNLFNCFIENNSSLANRYIKALEILNN